MSVHKRLAIGEQRDVLIDEQIRKCVAFLCAEVPDAKTGVTERKPAATAFFVTVPINDTGSFVHYAVTARHVLDMSRPYGPLYIRLNTLDGFEDIEVHQDSWTAHPKTDVAVARVSLSSEKYDLETLSLEALVTDSFAHGHNIGEGDDVFFIGLFTEHWGSERTQPIVRFGNISLGLHGKLPLRLNPDEAPVPLEAYLVEARSWGGHSGSPAFVYFPPTRFLMTHGHVLRQGEGPRVLGLVHGHYEIKQDVELIGDILGSAEVPVNAGIAAVIPAQKIVDTLMQEELVEEREELRKAQENQRPTPTPDSARQEGDYQRSDFLHDLKKVVRKLPPDHPSRSDSEKR